MTRARQLREFWKNLAVLVDSGMPLLRSLKVIEKSCGGAFKKDLRSIIKMLMMNKTFAEALSTKLFSRAEINMVRGGEVTGLLETSLRLLADGKIMLTRADQYEAFYRNLATMLTCGVPALPALKIAAEPCDEPLKQAIMKIHDAISKGDVMAAAMDKLPQVFSPLEVNLVDVGEETGCLDAMLMKLADLCARN